METKDLEMILQVLEDKATNLVDKIDLERQFDDSHGLANVAVLANGVLEHVRFIRRKM